jgi:hypothetical protein
MHIPHESGPGFQRGFLGWWQANVTPGKEEAGPGRGKKGVSERGHLLVSEATTQTGVTKQQVSRWNKRLADESVADETAINGRFARQT